MIVTCPSCETHFSVPDAALGPRGRTLRCARCGEKWHQQPETVIDEIPLEMPPAKSKAKPVAPPPERVADRDFDKPSESPVAGLPGFNLNLGGDGASFSFGSSAGLGGGFGSDDSLEEDNLPPPAADEDPFAHIAELMAQGAEPIPEVFASPPPKPAPRRKGGAALWLLVIAIVLVSVAGALFWLQEWVVRAVPASATLYQDLGLRSEVVGAGLIFRDYSAERMQQDNSEVLIVRGVIANTTDNPLEVPLLRLSLTNGKITVQSKIISPPQTVLDAHGVAGFRITLEQPDPSATGFGVTFVNAKDPAAETGEGH